MMVIDNSFFWAEFETLHGFHCCLVVNALKQQLFFCDEAVRLFLVWYRCVFIVVFKQ